MDIQFKKQTAFISLLIGTLMLLIFIISFQCLIEEFILQKKYRSNYVFSELVKISFTTKQSCIKQQPTVLKNEVNGETTAVP